MPRCATVSWPSTQAGESSWRFRKEHGRADRDVGVFLNRGELLELEPLKAPINTGGITSVTLNEGRLTLRVRDWEVLSETDVVKPRDRRSSRNPRH